MYQDHESDNRHSVEDFHQDLKDLKIASYQFEPELDQTNQEDDQYKDCEKTDGKKIGQNILVYLQRAMETEVENMLCIRNNNELDKTLSGE